MQPMPADDLLATLRAYVAKYQLGQDNPDAIGPGLQPHDVEHFVLCFAMLDKHLSKGGELPRRWKRK